MPTIPDPTTAVEVYAAQKLLVPLAHRVLGDTADYLGVGLENWTERRAENVQKILKRADERLTDEGREKGAVPPRVVKGVLEDGSFADDPLVQSYFGESSGLPIGERTRRSRRGAHRIGGSTLNVCSADALPRLRTCAAAALAIPPFNLGVDEEREAHGRIYVPLQLWIDSMGPSVDLLQLMTDITADVVQGLLREDLIERPFGFGGGREINRVGFPDSFSGLAVQLTPLGVQLFMWAHGVNRGVLQRFFDTELELSMPDVPPLQAGAMVLADLRPPEEQASQD